MSTTYWLGPLADRWNRRHLLLAGWILYVVIYFVLGSTTSMGFTVALFLLFGCYFGLTEPTERALVSRWAGPHSQGRFFGLYHGTVGLAALPAGLLFGGIWKFWGPSPAFYLAAGLSAVACGVLCLI